MSVESKVSLKIPAWKAIQKRVINQVQDEINKSALNTETKAKRNSPVDTGRLRASIGVDTKVLEATVGTNVEYAAFVEFGTTFQKAQPYLIPSFEEERQRYIRAVRQITKGI